MHIEGVARSITIIHNNLRKTTRHRLTRLANFTSFVHNCPRYRTALPGTSSGTTAAVPPSPSGTTQRLCVAHYMARMLFLFALVASTLLALAHAAVPGAAFPGAVQYAGPVAAQAERTVFLVGDVSGENRIAIMSAVAGCEHPGVVLFDNPKPSDHVKAFLEAFRP